MGFVVHYILTTTGKLQNLQVLPTKMVVFSQTASHQKNRVSLDSRRGYLQGASRPWKPVQVPECKKDPQAQVPAESETGLSENWVWPHKCSIQLRKLQYRIQLRYKYHFSDHTKSIEWSEKCKKTM